MRTTIGNLLCVSNLRANGGFAWQFIESLYAELSRDLARAGVRTWVAYTSMDGPAIALEGSPATGIALPVDFSSARGIWRVLRFVRANNIRAVYLPDRPTWHPAYALLRLVGVRYIVIHDHTSGMRSTRRGIIRLLKRARLMFRPASADLMLAVSEFVRRRKLTVDRGWPAARTRTMLNTVEIPHHVDTGVLRRMYPEAEGRPIIVCACRAHAVKGVHVLLEAFDRVSERTSTRPVLIYFGRGPQMERLERIRDGLRSRDSVIFGGYRDNVAELLGGADLAVAPTVNEEAFGLAALEPGARGVPVIASRIGGLPEVVVDGETGLLVKPGDAEALADAIVELLEDPERRAAMGRRARQRAIAGFGRDRQIRELTQLFRAGLGLSVESVPRIQPAAFTAAESARSA